MLYSIICVSTLGAPIPSDTLQKILAVSRVNNRRDAITGMLLHKGGHFLHLLEGVRRKVDDRRQRIALDYRLRDVTTLLGEPIYERQFASCAMGFVDLDLVGDDAPAGYAPYLHAALTDSVFRSAPDNAKNLLLSFRNFP